MHSKKYYISGWHAVLSLLTQNPGRIQCFYLLTGRDDKRIQALLMQAAAIKISVKRVSRADLDSLSPAGQHQGVVAECDPPGCFTESDLPVLLAACAGPPLLLVLDGVQDPHNLGACLRGAEAAGVTAVIAPKDRSVSLTETAVRVAP